MATTGAATATAQPTVSPVSSLGVVKKMRVRKLDGTANMECEEDELSPAQVSAYSKQERDYEEMISKLNLSSVLKNGAIVLDNSNPKVLFQLPNNAASPVNLRPGTPASRIVSTPITSAGPQASVIKQNAKAVQNVVPVDATFHPSAPVNTYQLVMDPRLGLVVGTVAQANAAPQPALVTNSQITTIAPAILSQTSPLASQLGAPQTACGGINPRAAPIQNIKGKSGSPLNKSGPGNTSQLKPRILQQPNATSVVCHTKVNSVGGMSTEKEMPHNKKQLSTPAAVVDLTSDEGDSVTGSGGRKNYVPDSKEIKFNKLTGKTFPSLVVVARPLIKIKDMTQQEINNESVYLDGKVKSVLMFTATKFTEWLIQQGLLRSEQFCSTHVNPDMTPVKLKLGMYSDVSKFPFSGGYVWISDCCPQRFVSVFNGSIFEGAPHAPNVLLKLIYYWSNQTSVANIIQWVKVDHLYVKTLFTNLRAICTAAICEKFKKLGGPKKKVEIGVISLGTTTTDRTMRSVKVEVLGMMECNTKVIWLKAVEPLPDGERNHRKRFAKILEPLDTCVDRESLIVTDYTVDKSTLYNMGFKEVYQSVGSESSSSGMEYSNTNIMEYLRRIIPRMFQNTLSLLSRPIMQQFLDELVWRERWGYVPAKAFDNIIVHLAEQTKLDTGDSLLARLQKVAVNPFKNWQYSNWKANCTASDSVKPPIIKSLTPTSATNATPAKRTQRKRTATEAQLDVGKTCPAANGPSSQEVDFSSSQGELLPLESYYYGSIPGDKDILKAEKKGPLNMKCFVCRKVLSTNVQMMNHLIGHALSEGVFRTEKSRMNQCRYCLQNFVSDVELQSHLNETHLKTGTTLMCLICEEKFRDRTTLILHMHRNHYELELPYKCGICGYRTSQHIMIVNHFYDVHVDGEKVQCPYCLKIVAFANNGRRTTQNVYFFLNHIQKHKRKTIAKKCNKCALWFVHKGILKEHQVKDHHSFKDNPQVERYPKTGIDLIMMPRPLAQGPIMEKYQLQKTMDSLSDNSFTVKKFTNLKIYGSPDGATCCECEGEFLGDKHFTGFLSCLKCSFGTCCYKAMQEHLAICHDSRYHKEFNLGKTIILEKEMHCVCGFKSASGNKLADHLATCGRKSAYPTAERAAQCTLQSQSASFPPLVTLDDQEAEADPSDQWLQAFVNRKEKDNKDDSHDIEKEKLVKIANAGPPSMLDVLGLIRKQSFNNIENGTQESENPKTNSKNKDENMAVEPERELRYKL